MDFNLVITVVGLMASLSSIVFAFLAFKRSERQDQKDEGKSQGQIMSDIGYIKACVDRMEKNLNIVDERYRNIGTSCQSRRRSCQHAKSCKPKITKQRR